MRPNLQPKICKSPVVAQLLYHMYDVRQTIEDSFYGVVFVIRLTLRVPLVGQELLTLPEHLISPPGFQWGSCYSIVSLMCNVLQMVVCLVLFLLAIGLSVLLTLFSIFKLFLELTRRSKFRHSVMFKLMIYIYIIYTCQAYLY